MKFTPPLKQGRLIRRYQRFLADVLLDDGRQLTIHCPNTGSMRHCLFPGEAVWFSTADNPKRKYAHTWELAQNDRGHLIGINTGRANALVAEAISQGKIAELAGYDSLRREVRYGQENSRIDLLLEAPDRPACYIEVKSCTLLEDSRGYFPDAVTRRGQKHLRELMAMRRLGHRAVLLFAVQHTGITSVAAADHLDPDYGDLLRQAARAGVEIIAYRCHLSATDVEITQACPVINLTK